MSEGEKSDFALGDRVEATAGDDKGQRGFVIAAVGPEKQALVAWLMDDGTRVWSVRDRIRRIADGVTWPRCGHEDCAADAELAIACWRGRKKF